jgi:uncharacterized protein with PQ loop repeat
MKPTHRHLVVGMLLCAILDSAFVYIQAVGNFTSKSACDVSMPAFVLLTCTSLAWVAWGWHIRDVPTTVAGGLTAVGALAVVVGIVVYGQDCALVGANDTPCPGVPNVNAPERTTNTNKSSRK